MRYPQAGIPAGIVPELEHREDVRFAGDSAAREAAGEDLGKRREFRGDAEAGLHTARRYPEARDDFVENQDGVVPAGGIAQAREDIFAERRGPPRGPRRLENNRGELAFREYVANEGNVVLRDADRISERRGWDAGRLRRIRLSGARADHIVVPAVEVLVELEELIAPGVGAGEPDSHQGGLGAGAGKPHFLGARHKLLDALPPLEFQTVVGSVMRALRRLFDNRPCDFRMCVAEEQCAVAHDIVDVLVSVYIPLAAALRMVNEDRKGSRVADVVRDAGGECPERLFVKLLRPRVETAIFVGDRTDGGHRPEDSRARRRQTSEGGCLKATARSLVRMVSSRLRVRGERRTCSPARAAPGRLSCSDLARGSGRRPR